MFVKQLIKNKRPKYNTNFILLEISEALMSGSVLAVFDLSAEVQQRNHFYTVHSAAF